MAGEWPHPPAESEPRRLVPQPVFVGRTLGLGALAAGLAAGGVVLVRQSAWFAPVSLTFGLAAALAAWAAVVQWVGSEKVDDHPWV